MATLILLPLVGQLGTVGGALLGIAATYIDQAFLLPRLFGEDPPQQIGQKRITLADEGAPIARLYGRGRVPGLLIWATAIRAQIATTSGKRGEPGNITYLGTGAYVSNVREITGLNKIWMDGKLMYDQTTSFSETGAVYGVTTGVFTFDYTSIWRRAFGVVLIKWHLIIKNLQDANGLPVAGSPDLFQFVVGERLTIKNTTLGGPLGIDEFQWDVVSRTKDGVGNTSVTLDMFTGPFFPPMGGGLMAGDPGQPFNFSVGDLYDFTMTLASKFRDEVRHLGGTPNIAFQFNAFVGSTDQDIPAIISSGLGPTNTPAYRRQAGFAFDDWNLSAFGSRYPSVEIKVNAGGTNDLGPIISDICQESGMTAGELDTTDIDTDRIDGFWFTGIVQAKSALQPLLIAYDLFTSEHGGKLKFFNRASSDTFALAPGELDARPEAEDKRQRLSVKDPNETFDPKNVLVSFAGKEYEYQRKMEREIVDVAGNKDTISVDLSTIGLSSAEARAIARRVYRDQRQGSSIEFRLPPRLMHLQENDILTVGGSLTGTIVVGLDASVGSIWVRLSAGGGEAIDLQVGDIITFSGHSSQEYTVRQSVAVGASTDADVLIYPDLTTAVTSDAVSFVSKFETGWRMRVQRIDLGHDFVSYVTARIEEVTPTLALNASPGDDTPIVSQSRGGSTPYEWDIIDIGSLRDEDLLRTGYYLAARAYAEQDAAGAATILRSIDDGVSWENLGFLRGEAVMGFVTGGLVGALGSLPDPYQPVPATIITVFLWGKGSLFSVTDTDIENGKNRVLIGNEVLQFKTATLQNDGTYQIDDFRNRGQLGTLGFTDTHGESERLIMLDNAVQFIPFESIDVGKTHQIKVVPTGMTSDDVVATKHVVADDEFDSVERFRPGNFTATDVRDGVWLQWDAIGVGEVEAYQVRIGTTIGGSQVVAETESTSVLLRDIPSGSRDYTLRARFEGGYYSKREARVTVNPGGPDSAPSLIALTDLVSAAGGTHSNTSYDATNLRLQLTSGSDSGTYTSAEVDIGGIVTALWTAEVDSWEVDTATAFSDLAVKFGSPEGKTRLWGTREPTKEQPGSDLGLTYADLAIAYGGAEDRRYYGIEGSYGRNTEAVLEARYDTTGAGGWTAYEPFVATRVDAQKAQFRIQLRRNGSAGHAVYVNRLRVEAWS